MYVPHPFTEPAGSVAVFLAGHAIKRELTVYAGAGVSAADPTNLPGASGLAKLLFDSLSPNVDLALSDDKQRDLLAVADAVATLPQGIALLRRTVLEVADLKGASENFAHEVLGLLLCEGAVTILETNYDDCIERGAQPERPTVVRSARELLHSSGPALLKAHGCATQPETMLITTAELAAAPPWAKTQVAARLRQYPVVFLGIGSVADYVGDTVSEICNEVGLSHLHVVDPAMADWDSEDLAWKKLLPQLKADQRDPRTAEEFCDALIRAYVHYFTAQTTGAVSGLGELHPQRVGVAGLLDSFDGRDAAWLLRWLREASLHASIGTALVGSIESVRGALAISALVGDDSIVESQRCGLLSITPAGGSPVQVMLMMAFGTTLGSMAAAEANQRVARARGQDLLKPGADVVVVVVGHLGPMTTELPAQRGFRISDASGLIAQQSGQLPDDIMGSADAQHIVNGAASGRVWLVNGDSLIEAA